MVSVHFVKLRYPYQNYEKMNEAEYREYSDLYVELGGPEGEAEFEFYPQELEGLFVSLNGYVKEHC